jgi:hypothetical protein
MTEPPQKKQKVEAVSQHVGVRARLHNWLMDHHPLPEVVSRIIYNYWIWDFDALASRMFQPYVYEYRERFPVSIHASLSCTPTEVDEVIRRRMTNPTVRGVWQRMHPCVVCRDDCILELFCDVCNFGNLTGVTGSIQRRQMLIYESSLERYGNELSTLFMTESCTNQ